MNNLLWARSSPQLHWVAYSGIPSTEPQPRIDRASGTISSVNNLSEISIPLSTAITIQSDTGWLIQ